MYRLYVCVRKIERNGVEEGSRRRKDGGRMEGRAWRGMGVEKGEEERRRDGGEEVGGKEGRGGGWRKRGRA